MTGHAETQTTYSYSYSGGSVVSPTIVGTTVTDVASGLQTRHTLSEVWTFSGRLDTTIVTTTSSNEVLKRVDRSYTNLLTGPQIQTETTTMTQNRRFRTRSAKLVAHAAPLRS